MMNTNQTEIFQGKKVKILEMILTNVDDQLKFLWKIDIENTLFNIVFYNVSRIGMRDLSTPLEMHGFEIIDHSSDGWEKDSKYEIHNIENDCIKFFCECFSSTVDGAVC